MKNKGLAIQEKKKRRKEKKTGERKNLAETLKEILCVICNIYHKVRLEEQRTKSNKTVTSAIITYWQVLLLEKN